jgi:hypothetical protein
MLDLDIQTRSKSTICGLGLGEILDVFGSAAVYLVVLGGSCQKYKGIPWEGSISCILLISPDYYVLCVISIYPSSWALIYAAYFT